MAEPANGKANGEEQGRDLVDHPTSGVKTPDQGQSREAGSMPVEATSPPSSSHGIRWLILLLMIVVLSLGWFLLPENTRQRWTDTLMNRIPLHKIGEVVPASPVRSNVPASAVPKAGSVMPKTLPFQPAAPEAVPSVASVRAFTPAAMPHPPPASDQRMTPGPVTSEEAKVLMAAMGKLQSKMQVLEGDQTALHHELYVRQQLELRTRLRWITSTGTLLPQMADFWQDIELLPLLSESERNTAQTMRKLAANDADKLNAWRTQLKRLAATLPVPEHQDIIPKPEQPVFSWFTGKFHLRPAPTPEQRKLSKLHARLLDTAHVLTVEIWPKPNVWRHLLADLREQFSDDADLALPERLDGIQKDIATMRAQAASWLEQR